MKKIIGFFLVSITLLGMNGFAHACADRGASSCDVIDVVKDPVNPENAEAEMMLKASSDNDDSGLVEKACGQVCVKYACSYVNSEGRCARYNTSQCVRSVLQCGKGGGSAAE